MPLLKYLQEVFHLRKRGLEAFRVMPFVQLCILNLLGISCCWDCLFCVAEVHVCVCVFVCAWGSFSLTHTCMQNSAYTKTHTRRGIFHLRREARPPSAFLTCNHVQICTGRQGEGESHVNLCGCFLGFFLFFLFFLTKPASDYRRSQTPEIQITFWSLSNFQTRSSKNIFLSVLFSNWKWRFVRGKRKAVSAR